MNAIKARCQQCGKGVMRNKSDIRKGKKKYCSLQCRNTGFSKYMKESGVTKGENSPNAKLTWEKVYQIRVAYKPWHITQAILARKFAVLPSTIRRVVEFRAWL